MRTIFLAFILVSVTGLATSFNAADGAAGSVKWNETTHQFGDLAIGPDAVAEFIFTNKSKNPVQILKVEPGCSCTISDFTPGEIKRNRKGSVKATYATKGKPGYFKKFIKVTFTDSSVQELIITGNVVF